jgi:hypothetical protein
MFGETSDAPPELPPIYTKPPDTKKTLTYPPNLPFSLIYDPFGGKLSKLPFALKLCRFAQNGVVLSILGFFFFLGFRNKKKIKKEKRGTKSGWLEPPHTGRMGVARPLGVVQPPRKAKKKKKREKWVWDLGGGRTTTYRS